MIAFIFQVGKSVADSIAKARIHENANRFKEIDPWGVGMTFIGMAVVFLSLLLLYILFFNISKLLSIKIQRGLKKSGQYVSKLKEPKEISGEISAAIGMALHLHFSEMHDRESAVLTINKVARIYSPWSSKIYGIRQFPR